MKQRDMFAPPSPKGINAILCGGKRAAKRPDWEGRLALAVRAIMLPLGFPAPVGRGFGDDKQFMFAASLGRRFTSDYAWPDYKLLVEVQGGLWVGGAHSSGAGVERDIEKAQLVALLGFTLLPVTEKDIRSNHAIKLIQLVLERLGCTPGASAAKGLHNPAEGRTSPTLAPTVHYDFNDPIP